MVVAIAKFNLPDLRKSRWIFDMGSSAREPWFKFYTYFHFEKVKFSVLWSTLPTQLALLVWYFLSGVEFHSFDFRLFFNILHPPLNVPALAISLNEDVDTNKELVAHGYSNFLSGLLCTVYVYSVRLFYLNMADPQESRPNYLVYVNTLL
jgi:SulP family sulfate permease